MRLEIDIPEHQYNNIMAIDSISLGRAPYKGIIMYAINAIKQGKVLEQEPTTKNDLGVDCISRADVLKLMQDNWHTHNGDWAMQESVDDIRALPSVTPQEPKKDIKLTNSEWVDFLTKQFDISRTSAKEMLHVMMSVKKEDNFKKQFSGRK